jgi:hypothetical protein
MAGNDPIHIKESRRGSFTEAATRHHMDPADFDNYVLSHKSDFSTKMERKAQFAENAEHWQH